MHGGSSLIGSQQAGKNTPKDTAFENLLKAADARIDRTHQGIPSLPASSPFETYAIHAGFPLSLDTGRISETRSKGLEATEKTLDLLERYQKAIADPQVPLKKVNEFIDSLSLEVKSLNALSGNLPPVDPLQKIMTEVGIISAVEIEKFKRGEYI
jgi:hypothetical protein